MSKTKEPVKDAFPVKLAAPAQRALANAGITSLKQLTKYTEAEVMKLHGMGPNAMKQLQQALKDNDIAFTQKKKQL